MMKRIAEQPDSFGAVLPIGPRTRRDCNTVKLLHGPFKVTHTTVQHVELRTAHSRPHVRGRNQMRIECACGQPNIARHFLRW